MVEGWESMVNIGEIDDNMMEADDKEAKRKGLTKTGDGLWDFNIRMEDWPAGKGLSSEVMMAELCKGLKWVWGKVAREWSVEEIIGWERYWEGREDINMKASMIDGEDEHEDNDNNDNERNNDKECDKDLNKIDNIDKEIHNDKVEGNKIDGKAENNDNDGNNTEKKNNKKRRRQRIRETKRMAAGGEGKPAPTMRWEARRRKGRSIIDDGEVAPRKIGGDSSHWTTVERSSAIVCELEWDGLDQRYVKKKRKKIVGGPVNCASTEVELATGASTETRRQIGCVVAKDRGCSAELRSV